MSQTSARQLVPDGRSSHSREVVPMGTPILSPAFLARPTVPYEEFIREKVAFDKSFGFEVDDSALSPVLLPHQRDIVKWAVRGGRRAIFARFGLGKSIMQLETLRQVITNPASKVAGGRALII